MITYLIQMIACSGILYTYYYFFLRNEKFHQYNRFYLLTAMALSLLLPLLKIPVTVKDADTSPVYTFVSAGEAVVVTAVEKRFDYALLLYIIYGCMVLWMLFRLVKAISAIIRIKRAAHTEIIEDIWLVKTPHPDAPFSFLKWLFWNERIEPASEEGIHMFKHEMYHIRSKHSLDLLFMEVIVSICWFNPFFYLYRKEVKTIQEFLADRHAAANSDHASYAELLLMRAIGNKHQQLINPFFHNQLKRRITMLTSSKKPQYQWLRKLLVLPVATTAIALFAFTYEKEIEPGNDKKALSSAPILDNQVSTITKHNHDSIPFTKKYIIEGKEVSADVFSSLDMNKIKKVSAARNEKTNVQTITVHLKTSEELAKTVNDHSSNDETGISTRVDKDALYPGDWNIFLYRNLNPQVPVDNGATPGNYTTIVQFIVDAAGNVSDVKAVSNVGFGMEDEAIRVIKKSGKWIPATLNNENVKSYRKQSITFQVKGKETSAVVNDLASNSAQQNESNKKSEVFTRVEIDAAYPGNWRNFLERNLSGQVAVDNGAGPGTYTTIIQFIVDTDGTISNMKALSKHGYGMEEEAMRVINTSGKWKPAVQNGREVKAYRKQPITFQVNEVLEKGNQKSPE
ncbi:energy transducer TonB [Niabella sp. 22666]|uniref:energy transducer TonB n=1 Tax=Niabella sp. 22666 TaxID=3453954 RepID=UPI003F87FEDA